MVTDAERTEKMQHFFTRCSSSDESRLDGDEGLRGSYEELIKRIFNGQVADKVWSTKGLCRMRNGCITDKVNIYRIFNGQNVRSTFTERTRSVR